MATVPVLGSPPEQRAGLIEESSWRLTGNPLEQRASLASWLHPLLEGPAHSFGLSWLTPGPKRAVVARGQQCASSPGTQPAAISVITVPAHPGTPLPSARVCVGGGGRGTGVPGKERDRDTLKGAPAAHTKLEAELCEGLNSAWDMPSATSPTRAKGS